MKKNPQKETSPSGKSKKNPTTENKNKKKTHNKPVLESKESLGKGEGEISKIPNQHSEFYSLNAHYLWALPSPKRSTS